MMNFYNQRDNIVMRTMPHSNMRPVPPPFITPPPSQNSSKHILNVLNDKCIQRVLTYLIGDIRDFLSAAEVCGKFQENAKKCFPLIYTYFDVPLSYYGETHLPLNRVKNFLSIFGHLIKAIRWEVSLNKTYDEEISEAIVEFCGKSLLRLNIRDHSFNFVNGSSFKLLEELWLIHCTVIDFRLPPMLKTLTLTDNTTFNKMEWMSETYPNLIEAAFMSLDQLNNETLNEFLALNLQLQVFCFRFCGKLTSSIFNGIATRVPNLVDLEFGFSLKIDEISKLQQLEKDIIHLSDLRHLRRLNFWPRISIYSIVCDFADNNVPIEDLEVNGKNPHIAESVAKLTNMKKLSLDGFSYGLIDDIIVKLPVLQHLHLRECTHISLNGVKKILEQATNLKLFRIWDREMLIDSESLINSILDLVRDRVQMQINVKSHNVHIPLTPYGPQHPDYKWLKLKLF